MAYPDLDVVPVSRSRTRRDLAAVVLMLLGTGGFVTCAFMWAPLAGAAAVALVVLAVGVILGLAE